jgi:DNA polymerase I-like protein with 3'-5' exonuclease and polymerase domains
MDFYIWCPEKSASLLVDLVREVPLPTKANVARIRGKDLPELPNNALVLMLGGGLFSVLQQAQVVPKKHKSITANRERVFKFNDTEIMVSFDPYITLREAEREVDLIWDVQLAARYAATGTLEPEVGHYRWVEDFSELTGNLDSIDRVACDLETLGLDPFAPEARIISISITTTPGQADVYYVPPDGKLPLRVEAQLRALLCSPTIRVQGANLKYDKLWMAVHWGIEHINQTFDTHLAGSLLNENRSNSLETHAKVYTTMGGYDLDFNRRFDKSRMDLVPKEDLLGYAGGDTDACQRVAEVQRRLITKDKRLARFYSRILQPAANVFETVERRGVIVDRERYKRLEEDCATQLASLKKQALSHLPRRLILKHADKLDLRPAVLQEFMFSKLGLNLEPRMFSEKKGEPSVAMEHLQMFRDDPTAGPFVKVMGEYTALYKTMRTYIIGFQKFIRADGRFHPTYRLGRGSSSEDETGGTVTGRTSATEPAYQCQPAWSRVLTRTGYRTMGDIVHDLRRGLAVEVMSHDGTWRSASTPHDNGYQPIYRLRLVNGAVLDCTGNHPVLTTAGWKQVQYLNESDSVVTYGEIQESTRPRLRPAHSIGACRVASPSPLAVPVPVRKADDRSGSQPHFGQHNQLRLQVGGEETQARASVRPGAGYDQDLPLVGGYEGAVLYHEFDFLSVLRGAWYQGLSTVALLRNIFGRHGRGAGGVQHRTGGCEWGLLPAQLQMDSEIRPESEQAEFGEEKVLSLEILWREFPTYGITVEGTNSYVSEGIVNHNTIPKRTVWAKPLRTVYVPPPGHGIAKFDFSQGELRIMACLARDPTMVRAYQSETDLHALTAANTMSLTIEQFMALDESIIEEKRRAAKAINFGLLYGMKPPGLVDYARSAYGVTMSTQESSHYWQSFFDLYDRLLPYHEEIKAFAHKHRHVRNPLGRIRHLPLINGPDRDVVSTCERQALNSPVQSCLSDMMLLAMVEIHCRWPDLWIFGMTHDSVEMYLPLDTIMEQAREVKAVLENLPLAQFGWSPPVKFVADAEIAKEGSLADVKKVSFS